MKLYILLQNTTNSQKKKNNEIIKNYKNYKIIKKLYLYF